MNAIPVIAVFDVGKTNKKLFLFDEQYTLLHEETRPFAEITDEDGFPCEDVHALTHWVKHSFDFLLNDKRFEIKALNFSSYGASFVLLDENGAVFLPLYNYLKPFAPSLQQQFYETYGGENQVARQTASPVLGNLNSGMQLYRIKYEKPVDFERISHALHLPQYLSYIFTGIPYSDITSIGCHTNLWDFDKNNYHDWVSREGVLPKLAPQLNCASIAGYVPTNVAVGVGLHDSSAALIPYLAGFHEPFILLSTGTWCISLNPFNNDELTDDELRQDCLCFLTYQGKRVKASRLFAGYEHENQVKRLSAHFKVPVDHFLTISYDSNFTGKIAGSESRSQAAGKSAMVSSSSFGERDLGEFETYAMAYHQLIFEILSQQVRSTNLVLQDGLVKRIFVDGGFSKNTIYMHMLAAAYPALEVFAASVAQASAIGAALVMHQHWNSKPLPSDIIELKLYSFAKHAQA